MTECQKGSPKNAEEVLVETWWRQIEYLFGFVLAWVRTYSFKENTEHFLFKIHFYCKQSLTLSSSGSIFLSFFSPSTRRHCCSISRLSLTYAMIGWNGRLRSSPPSSMSLPILSNSGSARSSLESCISEGKTLPRGYRVSNSSLFVLVHFFS